MTDKKGAIRISEKLRLWLSRTQLEERVLTEREPSYRELLDRLFLHVIDSVDQTLPPAAQPSGEASFPYAAENRELHEKLEDILASGDEATITAVVSNIEVFRDRLRPRRKRSSGRGRAAAE
jgi:hypothetical protein